MKKTMVASSTRSVAVVHTGPVTVEPLKQRFARFLPDVRVINIMDDSLLNDVRAAGRVTESVVKRMCAYFALAESMGVDAILNACSSVGETVPVAQRMISVPIFRVDRPMAERAVSLGQRIGVVATVSTTLDPTARLVREVATEAGRQVEIVRGLCDGALDLLLAGKATEHDQVVLEKVRQLAQEVDVIILAQVSIARLVPSIGDDIKVPVLSSPDSGVEQIRAFFKA
ncbi:MAG: aspartate/glutamate racemase family protein [Betaproteobacteria bacterium]